jgi:hypothetical protein
VLDIGCGPSGQMDVAREEFGLEVAGIDGDPALPRRPDVFRHDFTMGELPIRRRFDLGWSVEFVEHVAEAFIANFMKSFRLCQHVIMTHAPTSQAKVSNHVNCQEPCYWIGVFERHGFLHDAGASSEVRQASTMTRNFVRHYGLVFERREDANPH